MSSGIEGLIVLFVFIWLIIAFVKCLTKCCKKYDEQRRAENERDNERLHRVREQRTAARRHQLQGGARAGAANASAQAGTSVEPSAPPVDITQSRVDVVKSNLFFRELENADSVRTLSAVLAAANDRLAEEEGNVIARTWRAAEGSVRRMVEGPSSHECCICLDGYEAGETVCWSKEDDCDHIFHEDCIMAWLNDNDDCPLCRAKLIQHGSGDEEEQA
mmetsp:Transcript_12022/g.20049  ORF Transcript_12022/g.20049 Transcript_12022/m.20049 type:complete len:218 (-) Transcript_12022:96-749(-)